MSTMSFFQPSIPPPPESLDFQGQTIIVTGASSGLGLEFCRQFLAKNASTIIMAVRNVPKGEQAKAALLSDPSVRKAKTRGEVRVLKFDADSFESVKSFAAQVRKDFKQVNILMLNAGASGVGYEETKDGHEKTIQVNHLSNVLLLFELLPLLEQTAEQVGKPTRVTITGSRMYDTGTFCKMSPTQVPQNVLEHLDNPKTFKNIARYADSKLLVLLFIHRLGKLYGSDKVIINNFCPGMVDTPMAKQLPWYIRVPVAALTMLRARKIEQGGYTGLNAAAVASRESHGQLIGDIHVERIENVYNSEPMRLLEERLWNDTMKEMAKISSVPEWAVHK